MDKLFHFNFLLLIMKLGYGVTTISLGNRGAFLEGLFANQLTGTTFNELTGTAFNEVITMLKGFGSVASVSSNQQATAGLPNSSEINIRSFGYNVETHEIVTSDGYILQMQRIPAKNSTFLPCLVMHGILCDSGSWTITNQSLIYMLSDAGYDVWLGNIRGTRYGRKHKTIDPLSKEFWSFSLDDVATKDLPAMIDYILLSTTKKHLNYIGHSMGTTIAFILLSSKHDYNNKIKLLVVEAPVAYIHNTKSVLVQTLAKYPMPDTIYNMLTLLHMYQLPPLSIPITASDFCKDQYDLCFILLSDVSGMDDKEFSKDMFFKFLDNYGISTSLDIFMHFAQIYNTKRFQKYDQGSIQNSLLYGQSTPPENNLESIATPTVFYCGLNDHLSSPDDVTILIRRLKNHIKTFVIDDSNWGHITFIEGIHVGETLNQHMVKFITHFGAI